MFVLVTSVSGELDAQKFDDFDKAIENLEQEYNNVIADCEHIEEAFFDKREYFYIRNNFDEEYIGKLIELQKVKGRSNNYE